MWRSNFAAVINCGGQNVQLVARRIRAAQVYCEIFPHNLSASDLAAKPVTAIILVGNNHAPNPDLFSQGIPILALAEAVRFLPGEGEPQEQWEAIPVGGSLAGDQQKNLYRSCQRRQFYTTALTPQEMDTSWGRQLLSHFLLSIGGCVADWTPATFTEMAIATIKNQVGSGNIVGGLSGGVDSMVAATLVHKAVGDRFTGIFVDHGLLRAGEVEQVVESAKHQGLNLIHVDARDRFLKRLANVTDPERKRKIIGEEFIRVFEEEAGKLGPVQFLMQGTLYSDVVESGSSDGTLVKSHHNVGGLPERMNLQLVEPLRQLFKDEVREIGLYLQLPKEIVWRHPFPGPGLAIRIIGEITKERLDTVRRADAILTDEIRQAGLYSDLWQCFAVLIPVESVGVSEGRRTYGQTIVVRAVTSEDGMEARWAPLPSDLLDRISKRIVEEVHAVNRVVYDITSKPPATIEWE